jgi:hypothetical protein
VSRERLRRPGGSLTARQKSAEGVVGHVVGKATEALQCLAHHYVPVYRLAAYYAYLAKNDEAFHWLEMAADPKSSQYDPAWLSFLNIDPLMDPLRHDPRFSKLVTRIGFPRATSF